MITLNQYLATTRGYFKFPGNESQYAPLHEFYRHCFDFFAEAIQKALNVELRPPEFDLAYSIRARTEIVTLPDGDHIVYDQYTGQIINKLNRLFLEEAEVAEVEAYLYKLTAIRLLDQGDLDRALASAALYVSHRAQLPDKLKENSANAVTLARHTQTAMNEAFAIAHELCHHTWSRSDTLRRRMIDHCVPLALVGADFKDSDQQDLDFSGYFRNQFEADFRHAFERDSAHVDWPSREKKEELFQELLAKKWAAEMRSGRERKKHVEQVQDYITDPRIMEEFVCDALAAEMVDNWWFSNVGGAWKDSLDTFPISLTAIHHLRLFQMLDTLAFGRFGSADARHWERVEEGQARISLLRLFGAGLLFLRQVRGADFDFENPSFEQIDKEQRKLEAVFRQMNQSYTRAINDHVIFFFLGRAHSNFAKLLEEGLSADSLQGGEDPISTIAELCGFSAK